MSFLNELKRRNVLRVGAAYIVTAWLVIQVVETIFPAFGFGDASIRYVTIAAAIGFVPVLVLAWVFELTPEGLKRDAEVDHGRPAAIENAKRLDRIILVVLAVALGYFAFDKFVLAPQQLAEEVAEAREEGRTEALVESYGDQSIAVLAFENMSSDPEQAFFADGISEEILNLLAAIPELRVISRSSSFTYKGKEVPITQIAQELKVAHVLEGSVRKAGNRIRIKAQLIEGASDTHLWSQTWDRTLDDVFAIQDEIAKGVVREIQLEITGKVPTSRRTDPEVLTLILQAKQLNELGLNDQSYVEDISVMLERALAIDPRHVPALELKIYNDFSKMRDGLITAEEADQRWQADRLRILALDPDNSVIASYDAWKMYQENRNIEGAADIYRALLPRSLNNPEVLRVIGGFLRRIGKFEESIAVLERCVLVDPLKLGCTWQLKESYLWSGDYESSRIHADRLNRFFGRSAGGNDIYRMLLEGQPAEASQLIDDHSDPIYAVALRAMAAHDLGNTTEFENQMAAFHALNPDEIPVSWRLAGTVGLYAYLGDLDKAFRYLEEFIEADETEIYRNIMSPWYRPLHGDPRWPEILERLGLGQVRIAAIQFPLPPQLSAR